MISTRQIGFGLALVVTIVFIYLVSRPHSEIQHTKTERKSCSNLEYGESYAGMYVYHSVAQPEHVVA